MEYNGKGNFGEGGYNMFCPECGTKNDDEAKFCENCGAKLEEQEVVSTAQPVNNVQPVQVKKLSKKAKIAIIGVIAVIGAIAIFVNVVKNIFAPENIAKKYFESVANAEWEKVYGYYDLTEDEFVNKDMFKKMSKDREKIDYSNYAVKKETLKKSSSILEGESSDEKDSGISKIVNIEYALKNSDSTLEYSVRLVKLSKKKLLFFDNWKVVPEDMISKEYRISTLNDIDVYMDGKKLSEKYISKDKDVYSDEKNFVVYEIPSLFQGNHKLTFKGEYIDTYEEEISVNREDKDSFSYTDPEIKQSLIDELEKNTEKIVEEIYSAAVDDKKFSEIKLSYDVYKDKEKEEEIESNYKKLCESIKDTSYSNSIKLSKFKKKDFEVTNENSFIDEGSVSATIKYKLTYEGEFVKKVDDKDEKKKDEDETDGTISYKYIDGKWVVSELYASDIYYYWY